MLGVERDEFALAEALLRKRTPRYSLRQLAASLLAILAAIGVCVWLANFISSVGPAAPASFESAPAVEGEPVARDIVEGEPVNEDASVRLRITNGCLKDNIWVASIAGGLFPQDIKLAPGKTHSFAIPDIGLAATRFWPKFGCDDDGADCTIGGSGGPGESCSAAGCAPPVDSKFEATFGCLLPMEGPRKDRKAGACAPNPSAPAEPIGPIDWWDVSQVDGWTLPYAVKVVGKCPSSPSRIDCSNLALSQCPASEDLGLHSGPETLRLKDPKGGEKAVGCYSPCSKLTFSQWGQGHNYTPDSPEAQDFCCPTPPISPEKCSTGPVASTKYVEAVHKLCPHVYAFAYDDGVGLAQCPAGVRYDVTFYCPK